MSITDMEPVVAARVGALPADFAEDLAQRLADRLASDAVTIAGRPRGAGGDGRARHSVADRVQFRPCRARRQVRAHRPCRARRRARAERRRRDRARRARQAGARPVPRRRILGRRGAGCTASCSRTASSASPARWPPACAVSASPGTATGRRCARPERAVSCAGSTSCRPCSGRRRRHDGAVLRAALSRGPRRSTSSR